MSFHSITELFQEADAKKCSPGEIVCREEAERSELSYQAVWDRMAKTIPILSCHAEGIGRYKKIPKAVWVGGGTKREIL